MSITACLKVVFGEGQPKIIWTDQIGEHQYPSADVQNLAVFALLRGFFLSPEEGLPTSTDVKGLSGKYLGSKEDSYSIDGHPEGGVSLVAFTGDSVKNFLVSFYYNLSETEESEILSSSLSELNDTLIRNGLTEFTLHNSETVLTIQRCSQQEISNLEQENPEFEEFVDAFDMVYQTLPNIVEVIEDRGFEVARYKTNPDEILFRTECFLEETLRQSTVRIVNREGNFNNTYMYFSVEVNGVLYNAEKLDLGNYNNVPEELSDLISFYSDSGGVMYVGANVDNTELKVRLSPSEDQKVYSKDFYTSPYDDDQTPQGEVLPNGDFLFRLYRESSDW